MFAAALAYSLYGVTYHWTMGFMSGHEFRQAQTAIVAYYIDQQDNFSLLYETPILGKPWVSILLEVPIYEWSVVWLSRATGLPHVVAARTISAGCFYLMLPALWLLLGRFSVPKPRRLLPLALVLSAPVYIYYSRAFLMDAMALMCSVWWLLGFVRTMDERRWGWLALTVVAGTGAALIKSAVLAAWLVPGAAYGAWLLWRDLRARTGWAAPVKTVCWGVATVVVALGALKAWIVYTDPIKATHASAWIFTSKNLSQGNWGLFDLKALFNGGLWGLLMRCWEQAIMSRWLIGAGLVVGLALPTVRRRVLGVGSLFFVAQLMFPFAYAYQDYYFYICAVFLHGALGFALLGVLDSRLPRWVVASVFVVPFAAQVRAYWQDYRVGQSTIHQGGYPFTEVLRDLTPKNSIIIVAGADWAAMTPLYAQRKALMVRNGLDHDRTYLQRAFKDIADEEVSAFVVFGGLRANRGFTSMVAARFDMDVAPTFSNSNADIYISRTYARGVLFRLRERRQYSIAPPVNTVPDIPSKDLVKISPAEAEHIFEIVRPAPYQAEFQFGIGWVMAGRKVVLSSHPKTDLWLSPPANAKQIEWSYGIFPGAYEKSDAHTDGVEFIISGETPDGQNHQIYYRLLDPARNLADRSEQHEVIPYKPLPGESLRFSTRPHENPAFDWAYTIRINVK
ncbi:MAG: glycosyltransferase family 39 protein [Opitutae bacterium]|nr:glycosyltransferase family 39 protein [Opitutae bacterium]